MTRASTLTSAFPTANPPRPEKHPVFDVHHGIARTDDYAWMRADNWQAMFRDPSLLDGAIRAHLEAENAYQATLMA
ncbi:S9 family peptidase, partial [Mesorhizobium sp. M8A.F.Ca.ET.142.01.1.1]